jgi:hypothetical protein
MDTKVKPQPNCFSNDPNCLAHLEQLLPRMPHDQQFYVVWVTKNTLPADCDPPSEITVPRCLVILQGLPVHTNCLDAWRDWASNRNIVDLRMAFLPSTAGQTEALELITQRCSDWLKPLPPPEQTKVHIGDWVQLTGPPKKHDPSLLTMMFGSMGELLMRMDLIARRFRKCCHITEAAKKKHKDAVRAMLKAGSGDSAKLPKLGVDIELLPRVLLHGETGVGKTLFAKYLAGGNVDFKKVFIPEWLNKEDMLEYDLFGYARGAYTDGKGEGDIGKLMNCVGGVMFLDEIGTASPAIQAKLLGYMDDYRVEPRGWTYGAFECPTLVVAATNVPLEKLKDPDVFRPDLLARFTDIENVPPLRERMQDLPFILDCLLQNTSINPGGRVADIGVETFRVIEQHKFTANFRELENVLRNACDSAVRDGRNYICQSDLKL